MDLFWPIFSEHTNVAMILQAPQLAEIPRLPCPWGSRDVDVLVDLRQILRRTQEGDRILQQKTSAYHFKSEVSWGLNDFKGKYIILVIFHDLSYILNDFLGVFPTQKVRESRLIQTWHHPDRAVAWPGTGNGTGLVDWNRQNPPEMVVLSRNIGDHQQKWGLNHEKFGVEHVYSVYRKL